MTIDSQIQKTLLDEYKNRQTEYQRLCEKISQLIGELLRDKDIRVHDISQRCKQIESLTGKLSRPEKSYQSLHEITDLAGIRITTYFAEDVDRIAALLDDEFDVDKNSTVDKRRYKDPSQFGYSSLHYVVSVGKKRSFLPEYSKFDSLKCEIQIRSILQHAWAEIEHDLGYKTAASVPSEIRRRFARVAGLLELADDEFREIRKYLATYEKSVDERINNSPDHIEINAASLNALFKIESNAAILDRIVAKYGRGNLVGSDILRVEIYIERLKYFGIDAIAELEKVALESKDTVVEFVKYWVPESKNMGDVAIGIGLFYLMYVLLAQSKNEDFVANFLRINNLGFEAQQKQLVREILAFNKS